MALDGRTPSEEAGIDLNLGDNKWKGLIEKSVKKTTLFKINECIIILICHETTFHTIC